MTEQQSISLNQAKNKRRFKNAVTKSQRKASLRLTVGVNCHCRHRVHIRLGDILDRDRNVEIPGTNGFVVRRGDEPPILVYETDCVHWPQMLVVLLRNFSCPYVVLCGTDAIQSNVIVAEK